MQTSVLVEPGDGPYYYSFLSKNQSPPSQPRSTQTASEKLLADRPTAAGHPVDVKATQTTAFVAMEGPELYQFSPNG